MASRKREDPWMQGAAWALWVLADGFGHKDLAAMIADEGGFDVKDFEKAGVEPTDLDAFRKELTAITKRNQRKRASATA